MRNARLRFVGAGPWKEELEKAAFIGKLSGAELSATFASADVFMPSDSESLGFVVLESMKYDMTSGVPVVGAAAGGVSYLIDNENTGFLVASW